RRLARAVSVVAERTSAVRFTPAPLAVADADFTTHVVGRGSGRPEPGRHVPWNVATMIAGTGTVGVDPRLPTLPVVADIRNRADILDCDADTCCRTAKVHRLGPIRQQ